MEAIFANLSAELSVIAGKLHLLNETLLHIEKKLPDRSEQDQPGVDVEKIVNAFRLAAEKGFSPNRSE